MVLDFFWEALGIFFCFCLVLVGVFCGFDLLQSPAPAAFPIQVNRTKHRLIKRVCGTRKHTSAYGYPENKTNKPKKTNPTATTTTTTTNQNHNKPAKLQKIPQKLHEVHNCVLRGDLSNHFTA